MSGHEFEKYKVGGEEGNAQDGEQEQPDAQLLSPPEPAGLCVARFPLDCLFP